MQGVATCCRVIHWRDGATEALRGTATSVRSVPRNYTVLTIKTRFGEASTCAYPGCNEPLVFRDRGRTTVVAEIAHIRSEQPDGPRHDPDYAGDINGPENLLLLCGKHHRPVDRHEVVYSVVEMEGWKAAQRAAAGAGTPLTEGDVRSYARLSTDEQKIIMDVARIADRVITACRVAQGAIDALREAQEEKRHSSAWKRGPVYEVHDDGTRVLLNDRMQLPYVEQQEWAAKEHTAVEAEHPRIRQALSDLSGEVSVLRMMSAPLGRHAQQLQDERAGRFKRTRHFPAPPCTARTRRLLVVSYSGGGAERVQLTGSGRSLCGRVSR